MAVLYRIHKQRFAVNEVVFAQDTPPLGLYIVQSGHISLHRDVQTVAGATRISLGTLGPGSMFGELALIDNRLRSASAIAKTASTCLVLPKRMFEDECRHLKPWLMTIIRLLALRLRETTALLDQQIAQVAKTGGLMVLPSDPDTRRELRSLMDDLQSQAQSELDAQD